MIAGKKQHLRNYMYITTINSISNLIFFQMAFNFFTFAGTTSNSCFKSIYLPKSETDLAQFSCPLLVGAVRLQIPRLIQICEDYIGETLTPEKVATVLNLAVEVKSERLDSCCSDFIAAHVNNVMATQTLSNLRPQALKNLITRSVIPATALLHPPSSPTQSAFGFNSTFEYHKGGDSLFDDKEAGDEEVKDPMGSVASVPVPSEQSQGIAENRTALPLEKIKELAKAKIAMLDASKAHCTTNVAI